jgi:hypothetical protein
MGELHLAVYTYIVRALPPRSLRLSLDTLGLECFGGIGEGVNPQ